MPNSWIGAAALMAAPLSPASAQDMPVAHHHDAMPSPTPAPSVGEPLAAAPASHMHNAATAMPSMSMAAPNGAVSGSGTSRLPAADTMPMLHAMTGEWMLMAHGYAWGVYSDQGGPRGDRAAFVESMAMLMAQRPLGDSLRLQLRTMLSLEPLMGARGYPNLFATGETARGKPLTDRQHPHDLFMELAGRIDWDVSPGASLFVYGGPVAEPALGPSAFMHRRSARFNPDSPISHHWFDSTHITYGVVTTGLAARRVQIEASAFRGREPDEERWGIETPALDSWSVRASWQPMPQFVAQASYGRLKSPEALHPDENEGRLTASVAYTDRRLAVTAGYARKQRLPGGALDAWLIEANWDITRCHALFGRYENVLNDELFGEGDPLHDRPFRIAKATLGYAYSLPIGRSLALALGGSGSLYAKPPALDVAYGRDPKSFTLFAKLTLGR